MDPNDYFSIANYLSNLNQNEIPNEIFFRTAINRLYYGIFHLVQLKLNIIVPQSKIKQCHQYVKKQIETSKLRSDYSDLEEYRVDADYDITNQINYNDYQDALKIQQRITKRIAEPTIVHYDEDDEAFFKNYKDED
ncbi:MAG: hypothetical protein ACTSRI_12710 [Promethearchaeota archaeon]